MKRIYSYCLLLLMLLCLGNTASALKITLEWDTPGSIYVREDSSSGTMLNISSAATSYVYECADNSYLYIFASDGYVLTGAKSTDGSYNYGVTTYVTPNYISVPVNMASDGLTVKIDCLKLERNDTFTIDIVNGVDYLSAAFESGYELSLKSGSNSYAFNPAIDKTLTLTLRGANQAYSVTLDGKAIEKSQYSARYENINITAGCKLRVQVFENEADMPKDITLTLKYSPGLEDCLYNIRNWTFSNFIEPDEIINNVVSLKGNSDIQLNLKTDDYTYTKFTLNGVDITDKFNGSNIRFILPNENSTISIEGKAKEYGEVTFTGYISNADWVQFYETYGGATFTIPAGEPITSNITIGDVVFSKETTKKYTIKVSEKYGKFFFRPKSGYYISNVFDSSKEQHSGGEAIVASLDGTTFYMMAEELEKPYELKVKTVGSLTYARIKGTAPLAGIWGNPDPLNKELTEGEYTVSFIPGYETPLTVSFMPMGTATPTLYLDGAPAKSTTDSNSGATVYTIEPYVPANGSGNGLMSTIDFYNQNGGPTLSGASLVLKDNLEAGFYYSPLLHPADPAGQPVIAGTQMTVRPTDPNAKVSYRGEPVELDENGEFVFEAKGNPNTNIVIVSLSNEMPALDYTVTPAAGTVEDLSTIHVHFPKAESGKTAIADGAKLSNESNTYSHSGTIKVSTAETEGVTFDITFTPAPDTNGKYTFTVEGGTFTLNGELPSPAITVSYDLSKTPVGIAGIDADENGNVTVYTTDGNIIGKNIPAEEVNKLQKGIYIINGKKVIVK